MSNAPSARLWIVIPAHNRRELTLTCLRHLTTLGEIGRHTVLVVDDGSTDGTGEAIRREFPAVRVLVGDGNLWWTGAIALGMTYAFAHDAIAVCWLNDDCHPEAGTLSALAAHSATHTITAPVCIADDTEAPVDTAFIGRRRLATGDSPVQPVEGVSGFCVWIPREVWTRVGAPDHRRFPHYYGDTAFSLLARERGCAIVLLGAHRARLVCYEPRADSVREFVGRCPHNRAGWREVFVSPRSPFRLRTHYHYLGLRYGRVVGTGLFLLRSLRWQGEWLISSLRPQVGHGRKP